MGLVYYYEDGDGNGDGIGNCFREKGVWQGGERVNGMMGLFLSIVFIFGIQNSNTDRGGGEEGGECGLN